MGCAFDPARSSPLPGTRGAAPIRN